MPEVKPSEVESTASIKVIGVGGAGGTELVPLQVELEPGRRVGGDEHRCSGFA